MRQGAWFLAVISAVGCGGSVCLSKTAYERFENSFSDGPSLRCDAVVEINPIAGRALTRIETVERRRFA